jgi:LPS-assembly protein
MAGLSTARPAESQSQHARLPRAPASLLHGQNSSIRSNMTLPAGTRALAWLGAALIGACVVGLPFPADFTTASAQEIQFPRQPVRTQKKSTTLNPMTPMAPVAKPGTARPGAAQEQMMVQAGEIQYDYTNERVNAVGNVQIYYSGSTLEADKVIYDQKNKRLHAEGNVRLTEADGKITYGDVMDMSDTYRDGFVDSLRLDSPDDTRMAAARANRSDGRFTVLESGVYTACKACKDDPKRPPLWQVKAARIIHDEGEKMMYFESARLEFFGMPIAYMPYFSAPDPTVKRKSGFLMPSASSSNKYGFAVQAPYFWALAPDYDLTLTPKITTKQGPLVSAEFRQRMVNGSYTIRGAGIFQIDKEYFVHDDGTPTPGYRDWRGSIDSAGQFSLNDKWVWGWDAMVLTDKTFWQDYGLARNINTDPFGTGLTEGVSQLYLSGRGDRSFFDVRAIHYYGFSEADDQSRLPIIHPVLDYNYTFDYPVFGGELSYKTNFTSLSRSAPSFDAISQDAISGSLCSSTSADPAVKTPANCLLRGVPGTYSRFSAQTDWRRSITDSYGQVFTPFASLRADAASMSIQNEPGVSNYIQTGETNQLRVMPTVGLEYRYPFIAVQSWGTQTIEPIAQVIMRPNETKIGQLPNEDSQSLIFDDSNLFRVDKFSGWDRSEGGGRANYGVQYTAQFNKAGFFNVLFGQSYQLFGTNSFAVGDSTNTGLDTGLETKLSDYVARVSYQPNSIYTFTTRYRFDEETFQVRRFEIEARANFDRWNVTLLYGNYDAQPELGFLERRQGVLGLGQVKLAQNWVVLGGARYDIEAAKFDQTRIGLGYVDDCYIFALNYITNYTYSGNPTADHQVMLQMSLRTLGSTTVAQSVNGNGTQ